MFDKLNKSKNPSYLFETNIIKKLQNKDYFIYIAHDPFPSNPRHFEENIAHFIFWHSRYNLGDKHYYKSPREFLEDLAVKLISKDQLDEIVEQKFSNVHYYFDEDTEKWYITDGVDMLYDEAFNLLDEAFDYLETEKDFYRNDEWSEQLSDEELMSIIKQNALIVPVYMYDHSGISLSMIPFSCRFDSGQVGWAYVIHKDIKKHYGEVNEKTLEDAKEALNFELNRYNDYINSDVYAINIYDNNNSDGYVIGDIYYEDVQQFLFSDEDDETLIQKIINYYL
ncbi:MAG: hypothetical protein N2043_01465 [Ignavibacterium sp.]|nr:hypothetical protein [Ignavibacterium sp.]